MATSSDIGETPQQLEDALARLGQAKEGYFDLQQELDKFLQDHIQGMIKGFDTNTENFTLQIPSSTESIIRGRPRVLVAEIVENLRISLDYMTSQLSMLNEPDLNERIPQFIISESETDFHSQAQTRLRYLTAEQRGFIEQIQPYHGNSILGLLGEVANQTKHRHLLSLRNVSAMTIALGEITMQEEYRDYFMYPAGRGHAIFARPKHKPTFLLTGKHDAMPLLSEMIGHVEDVLRVSYCFFQGRPLKLEIIGG